MRQIPEVGDQVALKKFAFTNKAGGTGMSDWKFDEKFTGPAVVVVTKAWHDYETGWRYHGKPVDSSALLREYLKRNARNGSVYFSEFDLERIPA